MSLYRPYIDLFLAVSRRLETTAVALGAPLSIEASQILGLIDARTTSAKPLSAHEIGRLLNIEKSVLSRRLATLERAGFIAHAPGLVDKRTKILRITPQGKRVLRRDDVKRDQQISTFDGHLSERERRDLTELTRAVADNLEAPRLTSRSREPLRGEIARLTRALGFLSASNLFDTGASLEEVQLLAVLSDTRDDMPVETLKRNLPYDPSKLSRLLHTYSSRGLLTIRDMAGDKRKRAVALSPAGRESVVALVHQATPTFERALGPLPREKRERFQKLLQRLTATPSLTKRTPDLTISAVATEAEGAAARGFLLRELVENRREAWAPHVLVNPDNRTLVAIANGSVVGMIEWRRVPAGPVIENLIVRRGELSLEVAKQLTLELAEALEPQEQIMLTPPYLRDLLTREKRREFLDPFGIDRLNLLAKVIAQSSHH